MSLLALRVYNRHPCEVEGRDTQRSRRQRKATAWALRNGPSSPPNSSRKFSSSGGKREGGKEKREKGKCILILVVRLNKQIETQIWEPYRNVWQQFRSVSAKANASQGSRVIS